MIKALLTVKTVYLSRKSFPFDCRERASRQLDRELQTKYRACRDKNKGLLSKSSQKAYGTQALRRVQSNYQQRHQGKK